MDIILASTSPYRRQLLGRLHLPFRCLPPGTIEEQLPLEAPAAMAGRLALAKARSISSQYPTALVIGSDQVAALDGHIIGKPGSHAAALQQLRASSGRRVEFSTGVALVHAESSFERVHIEPFTVYFRELRDKNIENYLEREKPYDCAGSFKCEGLGIALFTRMEGEDPSSLEGLPLIALTGLLAEAGYPVLGPGPPEDQGPATAANNR